MTNTSLEVIGYVRCDYKEKFGIPRQSGLTGCAGFYRDASTIQSGRGVQRT